MNLPSRPNARVPLSYRIDYKKLMSQKFSNAVHKMRIPGQNIITGLLRRFFRGLLVLRIIGMERSDFGFIGGMSYPLDIPRCEWQSVCH